jgi:CopG family nickel-responsive transcriptional regulator
MTRTPSTDTLYRFGVSIEPSLIRLFDGYVRDSGYRNRSEAIRELIRRSLNDRETFSGGGMTAAVVSVFYSRTQANVLEKLNSIRGRFSEAALGEMSLPLAELTGMMVFGVRAEKVRVRDFTDMLRSIEGVLYVDSVTVPLEYLDAAATEGTDAPLHEKNPLHDLVEDGAFPFDKADHPRLADLLAGFELSGKSVLDAGCGTGASSELLLSLVKPGGRVVGIDFSSAALAKARERLGARAELRHEDLLQLGLPIESVDLVLSHNTFSLLLDQPAFLRAARHVLKPGGTLVICEFAENGGAMRLPVKNAIPSSAELRRMLSAAGFLLQRMEEGDRLVVVCTTPAR